MKKKQLIKRTRNISDEFTRQQVEQNGLSIQDYFLIGAEGDYQVCYWEQDGTQFVMVNENEANNFAVAHYLLRHNVPVYPWGSEVSNREPLPFNRPSEISDRS